MRAPSAVWPAVIGLVLCGCSLLPTKGELLDPDGDSSLYGPDCADDDGSVHPGAEEVLYDGVNNDCDPSTSDDDADGDGYAAEEAGGTDCDDGAAEVYPDAAEMCDGVDNDCDGNTDEDDASDAGNWYADADGDGDGDEADSTSACSQPEGYVAVAGDCDDGDAAVYSGAPEICEDGVVNDCTSDAPTAMADCGGGGTISLADADLKLTGESADGSAGNQVSGAGDVDGDGLDDLIVGAYLEDSGGTDAGAAYLLLGGGTLNTASTTISLASAELKFIGESAGDYAGLAVSGAGDVDGDGRDDLIVGAPYEDSGASNAGAAYLLLGGGALDTALDTLSLVGADLKLTGEAASDYAGRSVSGAGDVDGDGRNDLIVGADGENSGGPSAGAAYLLLSGGTLDTAEDTISLASADLTLTGEAVGDRAGYSVASAGDVDDDGSDDLVVGAILETSGGSSAGAAYLLLGGDALDTDANTISLAGADLTLTGEAAGDQAGISVSGAGDIDSDGRDDLIVGANSEDSGGSSAGAAYLLLGGGALDTATSTISLAGADFKLTGEARNDDACVSISGVGDVNGDGFDDLIFGAQYEDSGGTDAGAAYLLFGGGY